MTRRHIVKYIFVTGGVVSSLGKGISAASIGLLLILNRLKTLTEAQLSAVNLYQLDFRTGQIFQDPRCAADPGGAGPPNDAAGVPGPAG